MDINQNDKFYPKADEWMWNYCVFLGKFTNSDGTNYDLGIFVDTNNICAAIVDGDEPGDYYSGELEYRKLNGNVYDEKYSETIIRAKKLGYNIKGH